MTHSINFSEFCNVFYKKDGTPKCAFTGCSSQHSVVEFLLIPFLDEKSRNGLPYSDDDLHKIFKGKKHVSENIWETIYKNYNEKVMTDKFRQRLRPNSMPQIMSIFGINIVPGVKINIEALSTSLSRQFQAISSGFGLAPNIVANEYKSLLHPSKYSNYLNKAYKKYAVKSTLLYPEGRPFYDFFICNDLRKTYSFSEDEEPLVKNATLDELNKYCQYTLIHGNGGVGKSMFMQHLFLTSLKKALSAGDEVPIFVVLNEFDDKRGLMQLVYDAINRHDSTISFTEIEALLSSGKAKILLDGLDEIKFEHMSEFKRQLDILISQYDLNQYVMSSRRFSDFIDLDNFKGFSMQPFSKKQAIDLVGKLDYRYWNASDKEIKKTNFIKRLDSELYDTHNSFASNPLLLTIMFLCFRRFSDIASDMTLFYEQAYQIIVLLHDTEEKGLNRPYKSVDAVEDFTKMFSEFCGKSYRKGDIKFNDLLLEKYFDDIMSKKIDNPKTTLDNFKYDMCYSACLMMKEGISYTFIHKSFQEYLFAYYYVRQDDITLTKLSKYYSQKPDSAFDDKNGLEILYHLDPNRFEDYIILPYLDGLFCHENDIISQDMKYYYFINAIYPDLQFNYYNEETLSKYNSSGSRFRIRPLLKTVPSILFSYIRRKLCTTSGERYYTLKDFDPIKYEQIITYFVLGKYKNNTSTPANVLAQLSKKEYIELKQKELPLNGWVCNSDGEPEVLGYTIMFDTSLLLSDTTNYSVIIDVLNDPECAMYKIYSTLKEYHHKFKENYQNRVDEYDNF